MAIGIVLSSLFVVKKIIDKPPTLQEYQETELLAEIFLGGIECNPMENDNIFATSTYNEIKIILGKLGIKDFNNYEELIYLLTNASRQKENIPDDWISHYTIKKYCIYKYRLVDGQYKKVQTTTKYMLIGETCVHDEENKYF